MHCTAHITSTHRQPGSELEAASAAAPACAPHGGDEFHKVFSGASDGDDLQADEAASPCAPGSHLEATAVVSACHAGHDDPQTPELGAAVVEPDVVAACHDDGGHADPLTSDLGAASDATTASKVLTMVVSSCICWSIFFSNMRISLISCVGGGGGGASSPCIGPPGGGAGTNLNPFGVGCMVMASAGRVVGRIYVCPVIFK